MALTTATGKVRRGFVVLVLVTFAGCTQFRHSPTFADYQRAFREAAAHTNIDGEIDLFQRTALSEKELKGLRTRGDAEQLVGAGTQAHINDPLARVLLARATQLSPTWPAAWAALAYRDMSLLQNHAEEYEAVAEELTTAIHRWLALDQENSAPVYLEAAFECARTNVAEAIRLMEVADKKSNFGSCSSEIQKCVIKVMERAGRSKYVARVYGMGNVAGFVNWSKLSKCILAERPENQQAIRNCFVLGSRVGMGKSFLEQLIGDSIQTRAMEKLTGPNFDSDKARIADRKARIKRATDYERSLHKCNISEERWVRFLNMSLDKGEMAAFEKLAADNGDTL